MKTKYIFTGIDLDIDVDVVIEHGKVTFQPRALGYPLIVFNLSDLMLQVHKDSNEQK